VFLAQNPRTRRGRYGGLVPQLILREKWRLPVCRTAFSGDKKRQVLRALSRGYKRSTGAPSVGAQSSARGVGGDELESLENGLDTGFRGIIRVRMTAEHPQF
jgi:hypothetical protein